MSRYRDYTMHIHSTACLQLSMYDMHSIPHVHQYHMYQAPPPQCVHNITCTRHHLHNVYTTPCVHCTIVQRVHATTCTQYHTHNMYMTPHVHNATCKTCTHHHLDTNPFVQDVHNTTCTQHHVFNPAHHTICT